MASKKTQTKISVLLSDVEYERLDAYCRKHSWDGETHVLQDADVPQL